MPGRSPLRPSSSIPRKLPRGLNDSKLLTPDERERLYEVIMLNAIAVAVAFASAAEIDRINIRQATFSAMRRALFALSVAPRHVLIDGNDLPPGLGLPAETIVKGDAACSSIAAASIVAKVTRDRLMRRLCRLYPAYRFSEHFGYGTPAHLAAIALHGPCPFHRLSFQAFRGGLIGDRRAMPGAVRFRCRSAPGVRKRDSPDLPSKRGLYPT